MVNKNISRTRESKRAAASSVALARLQSKQSRTKKGAQTSFSSVLNEKDHVLKLYRSGFYDRAMMVKEGLPAEYVKVLSKMLDLPIEKFYRATGLARPTIDRKIRNATVLNQDESERVMGIARLVGQAQSLVLESGDAAHFDAGRWIGEWLQKPLSALAGKSPGEFMDTVDGRMLVSNLLSQQQSGAYG